MDQLEQLAQLVDRPDTPTTLVLQPTPYCNLDCSYCYLQDRDDRASMSDETLFAIARNILARCSPENPPHIIWHGGEPMTLKPRWYENAFGILARESGGMRLSHSFQTNGIGITPAWVALWREWDVGLGISLDGPADLHDGKRLTRGGRGSHALVMRGIRRLQAAGMPFHLIAVLTAESLACPDRFYDFLVENSLHDIAFNVEEEEGQSAGSQLALTPGAEAAYARFLQVFMQRMADGETAISCREVQGVRGILSLPHAKRRENPQVRPFDIVTVGVRGALSTFSPELLGMTSATYDNFVFGNVHAGDLGQMRHNPAFRRARAAIDAGVAACARQCAYFDVCGGGVPVNKFYELGGFAGTETFYCRLTRQITLETVLASMETPDAGMKGSVYGG